MIVFHALCLLLAVTRHRHVFQIPVQCQRYLWPSGIFLDAERNITFCGRVAQRSTVHFGIVKKIQNIAETYWLHNTGKLFEKRHMWNSTCVSRWADEYSATSSVTKWRMIYLCFLTLMKALALRILRSLSPNTAVIENHCKGNYRRRPMLYVSVISIITDYLPILKFK